MGKRAATLRVIRILTDRRLAVSRRSAFLAHRETSSPEISERGQIPAKALLKAH
jgi:hypothetical protein